MKTKSIFLADSNWVLYVLGLVLVTDVWRITERIFNIQNDWFFAPIAKEACGVWSAVLVYLLPCFQIRLGWVVGLGVFAIALLMFVYWYSQTEYCPMRDLVRWLPWRLFLLDITIAIVGAILISRFITLQTFL